KSRGRQRPSHELEEAPAPVGHCFTLELEADAELCSKGCASGRNFVEPAVPRRVRRCRNGGQRITNRSYGISARGRTIRQADEPRDIRVGIEVAAVRHVVKVGNQTQLISLTKVEVLADAHVPGKEIGLTRRITGKQEGFSTDGNHGSIVIRKL